MPDKQCDNFEICRLVNAKDFNIDKDKKLDYLQKYCNAGKKKWSACKRFTTKNELDFCPDFVMPDSTLSPQEILDIFDSGKN